MIETITLGTPRQTELVSRLNNYHHPGLGAKLEQSGKMIVEDFPEYFDEFKKWVIVADGLETTPMTSEPVDDIWHQFILFTKDYADFGKDVLGYFLHHAPAVGNPTRISKGQADEFKNTYEGLFGNIHPTWGYEATCMDAPKATCFDSPHMKVLGAIEAVGMALPMSTCMKQK